MYLSIDDVIPIDPDKAGKSFTDYLQTFGQITFFTLIGLVVVSLVLAIIVAKKAGYSGWWGAIAVLFPPIGLILGLLYALLKWPALKERDEALGVLSANDLTLPSHERKAIKEAERKLAIEDAARKRMEKAQVEREKADADRARFAASEAKHAADAAAVAAAATAAAAAVPARVSSAPAAIAATPAAANAGAKDAAKPSAAPVTSTPAASVPAAADAPKTESPAAEAPKSVPPKTPTVRPRTSTNETTSAAAKETPEAPEPPKE